MRRLSVGLLIGLIFINSLLPFSWASDNPMFDFYDGLTEIIEGGMNNPGACVVQAENYIKNNIGILKKAAETGRKMAQQNKQKYENVNQEDFQSAMEGAEKAMSDPKIAESMNKFMTAMNKFIETMDEFTMKHPDEGNRIMEILGEYSPQGEMY